MNGVWSKIVCLGGDVITDGTALPPIPGIIIFHHHDHAMPCHAMGDDEGGGDGWVMIVCFKGSRSASTPCSSHPEGPGL